MQSRAAITVNRPRDEVEREWRTHQPEHATDAEVTFKDAPGDRGTEIHVQLPPSDGKLGRLVGKVSSVPALAKAKDDLRRFKQLVETGEIARSDSTPVGESFERKFKQRPAQPLPEAELGEVVGTR
jgi:uncharacterized membrane protein